jgi:hypothetical protein
MLDKKHSGCFQKAGKHFHVPLVPASAWLQLSLCVLVVLSSLSHSLHLEVLVRRQFSIGALCTAGTASPAV